MIQLTDYSNYSSSGIVFEKIISCVAARIFFFYAGRNAWNSTWVHVHPAGNAFGLTADEAKEKVERERVQGSTWWIDELPACVFSGKEYTLLLTEINSVNPLSNCLTTPIRGFSIKEIANSFIPPKPNSIVRLICSSGMKMRITGSAESCLFRTTLA